MVARRLLALLLLTDLVGVVSLAYASPPDPVWEPGVYDYADFDDIVVEIVALTATTVPRIVVTDRSRDAVETFRLPRPRKHLVVLLASFESRAPPLD